jgi:hypothetical protein
LSELRIGDHFPKQENGPIYERNELGLRLIIALTSNWLKFSSALEWFANQPWNAFHWWYAK